MSIHAATIVRAMGEHKVLPIIFACTRKETASGAVAECSLALAFATKHMRVKAYFYPASDRALAVNRPGFPLYPRKYLSNLSNAPKHSLFELPMVTFRGIKTRKLNTFSQLIVLFHFLYTSSFLMYYRAKKILTHRVLDLFP